MRKPIILSFLLFIIILGLPTTAKAMHILGGTMGYKFLQKDSTSNQYSIFIKLLYCYKDLHSNSPDSQFYICIFDRNKFQQVAYFPLKLKAQYLESAINGTCSRSEWACLNSALYEETFTLPFSDSGYFIRAERCCRSEMANLTKDIFGNPDQGITYHCVIPGGKNADNNTPRISPGIFYTACKNEVVSFGHVLTDIDRDSLSISLLKCSKGASTLSPIIYDCPTRKDTVLEAVYNKGFTFDTFLGKNSIVEVRKRNLNFMELRFMPTQTGSFAYALKINEWRKGVLITSSVFNAAVFVFDSSYSSAFSPKRDLVKLYPNPASDKLIINAPVAQQHYWNIYSNTGQLLLQGTGNGVSEINTSMFRNGLYFVRVYGSGFNTIKGLSIVH